MNLSEHRVLWLVNGGECVIVLETFCGHCVGLRHDHEDGGDADCDVDQRQTAPERRRAATVRTPRYDGRICRVVKIKRFNSRCSHGRCCRVSLR